MPRTLRPFAAAPLLLFVPGLAAGFAGGPPADRNKVALSCAVGGCHSSFPLNSGPGSVSMPSLPAGYVAGLVYPLTVQVGQAGQSRWGFQISSQFSGSLGQAGSLTVTDAPRTQIVSASGVQYLEHTGTGTDSGQPGPRQWAMNWTAPSAGSGTVTMYVAGNAANGNFASTGDYIYVTTFTIPEVAASPTQTATAGPSATATPSATTPPSATATRTQTSAVSPTSSHTATPAPSATESGTRTSSGSPTRTSTVSSTGSTTATRTASGTPTPTVPSATRTPSRTASVTRSHSSTATPSASRTETVTESRTSTHSPTPSASESASATDTVTATPYVTPVERWKVYPNPFVAGGSGMLSIAYWMESAGPAAVDITDAYGYLVRRIVSGPGEPSARAGWNTVLWDGRNARGQAVERGAYVLRIRAGGPVAARGVFFVERP